MKVSEEVKTTCRNNKKEIIDMLLGFDDFVNKVQGDVTEYELTRKEKD